MKILTLRIRSNNDNAIYDAVNETLRELAYDGVVQDHDDHGWEWSE